MNPAWPVALPLRLTHTAYRPALTSPITSFSLAPRRRTRRHDDALGGSARRRALHLRARTPDRPAVVFDLGSSRRPLLAHHRVGNDSAGSGRRGMADTRAAALELSSFH